MFVVDSVTAILYMLILVLFYIELDVVRLDFLKGSSDEIT